MGDVKFYGATFGAALYDAARKVTALEIALQSEKARADAAEARLAWLLDRVEVDHKGVMLPCGRRRDTDHATSLRFIDTAIQSAEAGSNHLN